jgi:hypothetical protein
MAILQGWRPISRAIIIRPRCGEAGLELGGEAQDVQFHVALVQYFADAARYPGPAINTPALHVRKAAR